MLRHQVLIGNNRYGKIRLIQISTVLYIISLSRRTLQVNTGAMYQKLETEKLINQRHLTDSNYRYTFERTR